ncbi:VWA domain-containing protein [Psychromonas sp. MME2]|uniref:VWA domain-containing protein n=1 Tax=unclassified Psychromonas TaxID=2614957 RepID=UPI00339BD38E
MIDVSGSMSGTSIEQAKLALRYGIEQLADGDTFNIISFSDNSTFFAANALPVDLRSRAMANSFIDQLQASGGTNMYSALSHALLGQRTVFANQQMGLRQVIFITDASISNEEQILTMIDQNLGDSRLFMVAIGSAANHSFMKNSANLGKGSYTSISDVNQVNQHISALFSQLAAPVLTNLNMQWSDGSAVDYWPAPLSDLYQGEPLQFVFKIPEGKSALQISAIGIDQGTTKDWTQEIDLSAQKYQNAAGLDILWAKEKIDSIALNRQLTAQQKRQQISALGMQFHIVTKYTSLLAIEQKIARPTSLNAIDKQVKTEMPKGNTMRLPQTGLASGYYLQWALLLLVIVTLCWFVEHYFVTVKKERGVCL